MNEPMLRLPPVPLASLAGRTKDYILGRASHLQCTPDEVILELLDAAAPPVRRDYPRQPEAQAEKAAMAA